MDSTHLMLFKFFIFIYPVSSQNIVRWWRKRCLARERVLYYPSVRRSFSADWIRIEKHHNSKDDI